MFWGILHRTIFLELLRVFLLSLLALTGLVLMAGIVAEASQQGLGPTQILRVIPLLIPSTMPYTIPATTLFATCVVYGRLAHDHEILAIRAAGVHLFKVVSPGILLGLVTSGATLGLCYRVIPTAHRLLRSKVLTEVEECLYALLRRDRCIKQPGLNYVIFVRHVQGPRLVDALFKRQDGKGHYDVIAAAREARLRVDSATRQVRVHMHHCEVNNDTGTARSYFEDREWEVPLPPDYGNARPRAGALTWQEILARQVELVQEGEKLDQRIAATDAKLLRADHDEPLRKSRTDLRNERRRCFLESCALGAELSLRSALAGGSFFFVLVGCPVGIRFSRSDYLSAFVVCFLPIVFVYYPLLLCGINYAKQGTVPPVPALWAANALMAVIALVLFGKLFRH